MQTVFWATVATLNKPEEWSTLLPVAEFAHNSTTHSITQKTPFSVMMRYEPQAHPPLGKTFLPNLESWLSDLSAAQDDAQAAHKVAQQKMKEQISSKFTPWKVGDKIWLETTNLHMNRPKKLQMKWTSPFEVGEVISCTAFCLCIPSRWKIHPVFHTSLLLTYKETSEHGLNFLQSPPDHVDSKEEYEVEVVLGHCGKPGCHSFLIRWKRYSTAEDTWKLERNLGNAQPLITEYKIPWPADFPEYNHHHKARKWKLWTPSSSPSSLLLWGCTSPFPREWYRCDTTPAQQGKGRTNWQGTPGVGSGCVMLPGGLEVVMESGASNNPIIIPNTPKPLTTPTVVHCFQCQSLDHVCPQCPEYICPFCWRATPGHSQHTCPMCSCPICGELSHVGTSCPTTTTAYSPSLPPQMGNLSRFWVSASRLQRG